MLVIPLRDESGGPRFRAGFVDQYEGAGGALLGVGIEGPRAAVLMRTCRSLQASWPVRQVAEAVDVDQ